ncbi:hypothetical protein L210DRAFT_199268 [Boletus edulis BED1]|uniref:Uncharacterized protein n=1 Tax=Boletus edulis BED1 TaxID=1328754 RepID=A0AAD4BNX0_BOLED|nr:hypothetical protein L210DRAFT_199268 [Boletus edulis BED1]
MQSVPIVRDLATPSSPSVQVLSGLEHAAFSGGPLAKNMGDTLVAAGVKPSSIYGATKVSPITCTFKSLAELALWDWVRFGPNQWVRWVAQGGWDVRVTSAGAFVSEASIGDMSVNNDVGSLYNAWGYKDMSDAPSACREPARRQRVRDRRCVHQTLYHRGIVQSRWQVKDGASADGDDWDDRLELTLGTRVHV